MVEGGEKLGNIKGQSASWQVSDLLYIDKVDKCDTSIRGGLEFETIQLTLMDEVVWNRVKL